MSHDHHNHCDHQLKYCDKCDVAYCATCNLEWKQSSVSLQDYWRFYDHAFPFVRPNYGTRTAEIPLARADAQEHTLTMQIQVATSHAEHT